MPEAKGIMEEKNFLSFMEFIRLLEREELKGATVSAAAESLKSLVAGEMTSEQRYSAEAEFPYAGRTPEPQLKPDSSQEV